MRRVRTRIGIFILSSLGVLFLRLVIRPRERHHPIGLPGLGAVAGEGLFKAGGIRSDGGEAVASENGFAAERFLIEKLAAPILEFADHRLRQDTVGAARPIETPLVGLGIVETQADAFDVTGRPLHLALEDAPPATP